MPPPKHTATGKNFWRFIQPSGGSQLSPTKKHKGQVSSSLSSAPGGGLFSSASRKIAQGVDPPLQMREALLIFVESSRSMTPALCLDKHKSTYNTMREQHYKAGNGMNDTLLRLFSNLL